MVDLTPDVVRAALDKRRADERIAEEAACCQQSLRAFAQAAWLVVEPSTPFHPNWHIDAIIKHLEAVTFGEIDRLLINIPPRHMKTLLVSVFWPAWIWTRTQHTRFLTASYGAGLAERDAIRSRDLICSAWYLQRWPTVELKRDVNRVNRYENLQTGYRVATGVGGEATGEGGDIIIIDDPHKFEEAHSDAARNRVIDWHDGTLATRFNDPKTGVEVVVMQRLHQADLSGHLLERGGFTHLCLPARYEPTHPFIWPDDPRRKPGELLWPDHIPEAALARVEQTLGSFRAAGQLQQRPAAPEGELLKRAWWQFYSPEALHPDNIALLPRFDRIVSSWDTAFEGKTTSDYVVGQVWGIKCADRYLLHSYRQHANLQATIEAMRNAHAWVRERWPRAGHTILVEKSANGAEIINTLKHELSGITPVTVTTDKVSRAVAASAPLEAGNIHVPGERTTDNGAGYRAPDWVQNLIEEAALFPNGKHDDQIDAFSQAINWSLTHQTRGMQISNPAKYHIPENLYAIGLTTNPSYTSILDRR